MPVARGLRKAVIELAPPRAAHMRQHPIQRHLSRFIRVESLVEKVPQKPPALRDARRIRELHRRNRICGMLLPSNEIAHRGESKPSYNWVLHHIHQLVNLARYKA